MVRALELSFAPPAPELAPYVSAYYHVYFDYPLIEDFERADVGYLRFMFGGHGFYHYPGGRRMPDRPVMLLGPASIAVGYSMAGPLNSFGCVLLPEFWEGSSMLQPVTMPTMHATGFRCLAKNRSTCIAG